MNLEKIIQLITKNSDINIQYYNINGKEKLIINGEEIKEEDTSIKEEIEEYKKNVEELDSCLFVKALEPISNNYDLANIDKFLNKENYSYEEAKQARNILSVLKDSIKRTILEEISTLQNLSEKF